jgi:hypothetical protein
MAGVPSRANLPPLTLHVPEPKFRPGDPVDFAAVDVPPAGSARRPDTADDPKSFHDLAYTLIRVLDEEGRAVGPWDPKLSPDQLRRMLRAMVMLRAFDDRMFRAQRQGKTSFYMKATGEEAVAVPQAFALDRDDMCFPSYRQQGLLIARGYPLVEMMNQIYSNKGDKLQGKQLPIMYSAKDHGFFSISGNLATQFPQAVGWAMASAAKGDTRSPRPGAARARPRRATSTPPAPLRPCTARRASSTSSTINGRSPASPVSRARRRPPSRRARSAMASPACGWTETTRSPSMRRRSGRRSARAPTRARR